MPPPLDPASTRILLVGLGLIGGSYAQALSAQGFSIDAIDPDTDALAFAAQKGWIARSSPVPDPALLADADLAIFALYPRHLLPWIAAHQQHFRPGTLLTDTTGVKTPVAEPVQKILRPDLEFLPAHPMAGREKSGVRHADASVFRGANFIITPTSRNTPAAIQTLRDLATCLGFARISLLSPADHDNMVAYLSQLTHCIAVALMDAQTLPDIASYTGDSFRDLTRIADINDRMWAELFIDNRTPLLAQIDNFMAQLACLRAALDASDAPALRSLMRLSSSRRRAFS